jgi:hypothetical protein
MQCDAMRQCSAGAVEGVVWALAFWRECAERQGAESRHSEGEGEIIAAAGDVH